MKQKLQNIASIRTGFTFRSSLETVPVGGVSVVQIKDLSSNGVLNDRNLARANPGDLNARHFLKPDEILYAARGSKHRAGVFNSDKRDLIASGQFLIITIHEPSKLLPEYLSWYLNSEPVTEKLNSNTLGATIPHVSIAMLKEIEVEIPPIEIQKQIVELHQLGLFEISKLRELTVEKEKLNKNLPMTILKTFQKEQDHG